MRVYPGLVRPLLFRADPERAHDAAVRVAELASGSRLVCRAVAARAPDPRLAVEVAGMRFAHAAGARRRVRQERPRRAAAVGARVRARRGGLGRRPIASDGNPRPRLFRLPDERAIVVHYGVPNDGAERVAGAPASAAARAARHQRREHEPRCGLGGRAGRRGDRRLRRVGHAAAGARRLRLPEPLVPEHARRPRLLRRTRAAAHAARPPRRGRRRARRCSSRSRRSPSEAEIDSFLEAVDAAPFVSGFSVNLPPGSRPGTAAARSPGRRRAAAAERTIADLYRRIDRRVTW